MPRKKISEKIKAKIRQLARNRCGYCLSQQEYVWDVLEIDHIFPLAKGGKDNEDNLWLISSSRNAAKYKVEGKTAIGRITVLALDLNKPRFIKVRENWVLAGWHPPKD